MQISEIYKNLKGQEGLLAGMEQQIQALLDTNKKNMEKQDCLEAIPNRKVYFINQHRVFNVLIEAVGDMKIMNGYSLLEIEIQLRQNK